MPLRPQVEGLPRAGGGTVEYHHLATHEETDFYQWQHGVDTTLQTFISRERPGGHDDLCEHFGKDAKTQDVTSHKPVSAIFSTALCLALAVSSYTVGTFLTVRAFEWFIAMSMAPLAVQKLQDMESFATMFLNYALQAQRWVRYGYVQPFGEALAGILMNAGTQIWIVVPVALFIGAVSIFKEAYIDRREHTCACVGD